MADSYNGGPSNVEEASSGVYRSGEKRKSIDSSFTRMNSADAPTYLSELPRYDRSVEKSQAKGGFALVETLRSRKNKQDAENEEFDREEWDDPVVRELEPLLVANLCSIYCEAIREILKYGYSEQDIVKSLSRRGFYQGTDNHISTIVNDSLTLLKEGKRVNASLDYPLFDLQHLVGYTLLEMVRVLREIRTSLTVAETMWLLLVHDFNVIVASKVDSECASCSAEKSSGSTSQLAPVVESPKQTTLVPNEANNPNSVVSSGKNKLPPIPELESFPPLPELKNPKLFVCKEKKSGGGRNSRKDGTLRRKICLKEKKSSANGDSKSGRVATLSDFFIDERGRLPIEPNRPVLNIERKSASKLRIKLGPEAPLADADHIPTNIPPAVLVTGNSSDKLPSTSVVTESATLSKKEEPAEDPETNVSTSPKTPDYYASIPYDEAMGKYLPRNKKDEIILELVPQLQGLQSAMQNWTEWANTKVMQVARRLSKDQPELKALRLEKEVTERSNIEKYNLDERNLKRLTEMNASLSNASKQIQQSNSTAHKLELQNILLKRELEGAKQQAAESAARAQKEKAKEKKSLKDVQPLEGRKTSLQGVLDSKQQKVADLQKEIIKMRKSKDKTEFGLEQMKEEKEELLAHAAFIRKERDQLEAAAKAEEDMISLEAGIKLSNYNESIKELENKVSEMKLQLESKRVASLRMGIDESYGSSEKGKQQLKPTSWVEHLEDNSSSAHANKKRDRECVMCLSEDRTVVFLPCSHQVLCSNCNAMHENKGMMDCPNCRSPIFIRICARYHNS